MGVRARMHAGLARQLRHPAGLAGHLVGLMMNRRNRRTITAAVDALAPSEGAVVADIGFGGGVGVELLLDRVGAAGRVHAESPWIHSNPQLSPRFQALVPEMERDDRRLRAIPQTTKAPRVQGVRRNGARGTRTPDLLGAIQDAEPLNMACLRGDRVRTGA